MGNWWLAASSPQCTHSCITFCAEFFGETSNHPGDSASLQARFGALWLLAFSKTKITFEREDISDHRWDSEKYNGEADSEWENCVRSQGAYFEGYWGIIVLWTMFLVSSSINVSVFHMTWLDTFWTDPVIATTNSTWTDLTQLQARRQVFHICDLVSSPQRDDSMQWALSLSLSDKETEAERLYKWTKIIT